MYKTIIISIFICFIYTIGWGQNMPERGKTYFEMAIANWEERNNTKISPNEWAEKIDTLYISSLRPELMKCTKIRAIIFNEVVELRDSTATAKYLNSLQQLDSLPYLSEVRLWIRIQSLRPINLPLCVCNKVTNLDIDTYFDTYSGSRYTVDSSLAILRHFPNVKKLNLINYYAYQLPPSVFSLIHLTHFELHGVAQIGEGIGALKNLKKLVIKCPGMGREIKIPNSIRELQSLKILAVENVAHIPTALYQLIGLEELYFHYGQIEEISTDIMFLHSLKVLYIVGHKLRIIPHQIGLLSQLERLNVSHNQLDSLPSTISKLRNLEQIDISHNKFLCIPAYWAEISNLTWLKADNNKISAFSLNPKIEYLYLGSNNISIIPNEMSKYSLLQKLDLNSNPLIQIDNIGSLTNLEHLTIDCENITSLPREIGNLTRLITLSMISIRASAVPKEILQLKNLKNISIIVEDRASEYIFELQNLESLSLTSTNSFLSYPKIKKLTFLKYLTIKYCYTPGFYRQFTNLKNLKYLSIEEHPQYPIYRLSSRIKRLKNLEEIVIDASLKKLPSELVKMKHLKRVRCSSSQLSISPSLVKQKQFTFCLSFAPINAYQYEGFDINTINYYDCENQ